VCVCVKLDTNQKQILCENQQLNLENEALREKICDQKGNLTEFELDLLWKNKELKKLRLTKRKNETLQHENQSLKENITFINQRLSRACIVHLVIKKNNWSYVKTMSCVILELRST
jgi:regulator of replication initiation timing